MSLQRLLVRRGARPREEHEVRVDGGASAEHPRGPGPQDPGRRPQRGPRARVPARRRPAPGSRRSFTRRSFTIVARARPRPAGRDPRALGLERRAQPREARRAVAVALGPAGREPAEVLARVVARHRGEGGADAATGLRDRRGAAARLLQVGREQRVQGGPRGPQVAGVDGVAAQGEAQGGDERRPHARRALI